MRAAWFCVCMLLVVACASAEFLSPLFRPDGAVRFEPTAIDERGMLAPTRPHFDAAVRCSGIARSYDAVRWYWTPERERFTTMAGNAQGWWDGGEGIYLSRIGRYSSRIIVHETLHYLSRRPDHPASIFGRRGRCSVELFGE